MQSDSTMAYLQWDHVTNKWWRFDGFSAIYLCEIFETDIEKCCVKH